MELPGYLATSTGAANLSSLPCRRRPLAGSESPGPWRRALHPPHHAREQLCLRLLPAAHAPGPRLAVLTAGEDGSLRQLLSPLGTAATAGGAFVGAALLGEQALGTAIKTLSLVPAGPGLFGAP